MTPLDGEKVHSENGSQDASNTDNMEVIDWDGPNDPENPFNWSPTYKWVLTITTCFISILTGLPAGAYGAADDQMSALWNVSNDGFVQSVT